MVLLLPEYLCLMNANWSWRLYCTYSTIVNPRYNDLQAYYIIMLKHYRYYNYAAIDNITYWSSLPTLHDQHTAMNMEIGNWSSAELWSIPFLHDLFKQDDSTTTIWKWIWLWICCEATQSLPKWVSRMSPSVQRALPKYLLWKELLSSVHWSTQSW